MSPRKKLSPALPEQDMLVDITVPANPSFGVPAEIAVVVGVAPPEQERKTELPTPDPIKAMHALRACIDALGSANERGGLEVAASGEGSEMAYEAVHSRV